MEGEKVKEISFHGYGCAISKASASILTEKIEGKSIKEIDPLVGIFLSLVKGEEIHDPFPDEFHAFAEAKNHPGRQKCATLSWDALKSFIDKRFSLNNFCHNT